MHVKVEARTVPISALQTLAQSLPTLIRFTLTPPCVESDNDTLVLYVDACMQALHSSTSLTSLVLDLQHSIWVSPRLWLVVPKNLNDFFSHSEIHHITNAPALLFGLHTLSLTANSYALDFSSILRKAPRLKQLSIHGQTDLTFHGHTTTMMFEIFYLMLRMMAGFQLIIPSLWLDADSTQFSTMVAFLPPLPSVQSCTLHYHQTPSSGLERFAHVFPSLTHLNLRCSSPLKSNTHMGMELLAPLAECVHLQRLEVHMRLNLTTAKLVQLCQCIPSLAYLGYMKRHPVSLTKLRHALLAHGQAVEVVEYSKGDLASW